MLFTPRVLARMAATLIVSATLSLSVSPALASAASVVAAQAEALQRSGDTLLSDGEMAAAAAQFAKAAVAEPKEPFFRLNLGVALAAIGKLDEAASQFRQARALADDDVIAALLLEGALAEQGKTVEAQATHLETVRQFARNGALDASGSIARLETAVKRYPQSPIAYLLLGDAYQVSEQWDKANAVYSIAIRLAPRWTKPRVNLGVLYLAQGKPADAVRIFEEALKVQPQDARVQLYQGDAQALLGNTADALKAYRAAAKREPSVAAEAMTRSGNVMLRNRRVDEANVYFGNAQKLAPRSPAPVAGQAEALVQKGDFTKAAEAYKSALRLAGEGGLLSTRPILFRGLAEAQLSDGKAAAALATLDRALKDEPRSAPLWHRLRAQAYFASNEDDRGEEALRQALEAETERYPIETLNALAARGLIESATDAYTAQQGGPARPMALSALAHLARYKGDTKAEVALREQAAQARGSGADMFLLADAYERAGRRLEALEAYRKAVKFGTLSDSIREWAGRRITALSGRQP